MIAAHRRRHRIVWWLLAVAIPVLLWLAVSARPDWPADEALGERLAPFSEETP